MFVIFLFELLYLINLSLIIWDWFLLYRKKFVLIRLKSGLIWVMVICFFVKIFVWVWRINRLVNWLCYGGLLYL